jgi:CubicO group peptidase (beta-lactamase class C family)
MRTIFLLSIAAGLYAQTNSASLDKIGAAEIARQKIPGMAVVVVRDSRVIYAQGFGLASVESKNPVTPDTFFRTGAEKLFFTVAAVELADQGRLRLDAPLGDYLVGLDEKDAALTVEQVLSPTSGDEGGALAGRLIAVIRAKPFPAILEEMVFGPLGMKSTTFNLAMAMTYPLALGHTVDKQVLRPVDGGRMLFSSANEMGRLLIAILNDGKLGDDILNQTQVLPAPVVAALTQPGSVGLDQAGGGHLRLMASAAPGYSSAILLAPEFKTGLIVVTNRAGADAVFTARKFMDAVIPVRYPAN